MDDAGFGGNYAALAVTILPLKYSFRLTHELTK